MSSENSLKIHPNTFYHPEILVFTSHYQVYKLANKGYHSVPAVLSQLVMEAGEKPLLVTGTKTYSGFLLVAFENGKMGKINFTAYQTEFNRKKLKNVFNGESPLVFIEHAESDIDLAVISSLNKVMVFNTSLINAVDSKTTKGVQVIKSKDNSVLAGVKKLSQVNFQDSEYYRRAEGLNTIGYYLKPEDEF